MDVVLPPPRVPEPDTVDTRSNFTRFTERLWAYLTIKELLRKEMESSNDTEQQEYRQRALQLSLKYSFVTPLTSMVVTKPDEQEGSARNLEDADSDSLDEAAVVPYKLHSFSSNAMPRRVGGKQSYFPAISYLAPPGIIGKMGVVHAPPPPLLGAGPWVGIKKTKATRTVRPHTPSTVTPGQLTTTSAPSHTGQQNNYFFMKVKSSSSPNQRIPVCLDIRPADGAIYQLVHDNITGLTINVKVNQLGNDTYLSEIYISMPTGKHVHLTPGGMRIGNNNTMRYQPQTLALGRGWKIVMRNKNQIRLRYGSRHTIRIRRGTLRHASLGKKSTLSVVFVKGVHPEATGVKGYLWHASANIRKERRAGQLRYRISVNVAGQANSSCPAQLVKQQRDINSGAVVKCFTGHCLNRHIYRINNMSAQK